VAIDVTEHPINRPQQGQEDYYSDKKKRHTTKSQIVAANGFIYDVDEAPGSDHDFELCKATLLTVLILLVIILADSSYQGIQQYHEWSLIPIKKSKKRELSESPCVRSLLTHFFEISILR
jgi:predicted aminopeptidase